MKTYGIDANPAARSERTGTEQYAFNLIEAMKQIPLADGERVVLYSAQTLTGELAEMPQGWSSHVLGWPIKRLWTQGRLSWEMWRRAPDVLFVPAHVVPKVHPKRTVTTVHDVGFHRYPSLYTTKARRYLEASTKFAIKTCAAILTPSAFTKQELVELYHAKAEKIFVTPLAPGSVFVQARSDRSGDVLQENLLPHEAPPSAAYGGHYFLTVSRMEAKKNIATLIRAFEMFKERRGIGDPFQLLLVGKPGFGFEQIRLLIDRSPFKDAIRLLGFVDDAPLLALMRGATAYVYPSWYEGLGISAIEALSVGTPLIASNIPALREAAEDAALYFAPSSPEELSARLRQAADGDGVEVMRQKGLARAAAFDWNKTAEATWSVLREPI